MGFSTDIEKESVEKISLAVISPRVLVTGWTLSSANVYSAPFTKGNVSKVWASYLPGNIGVFGRQGFTKGTNITPAVGEFFYDTTNQVLYVGTSTDPDSGGVTFPASGVTVQFDVYVASAFQTGYSDPTDATSAVVDWEGKLLNFPSPAIGSIDDIFGFQPVNIHSLSIANDGWLNPILHDVSWINAEVKVFLLTGKDYQSAFDSSGIRQVFIGFVSSISESENVLNVRCSDYLGMLDRQARSSVRYSTATFPNAEPNAVVSGKEWFIRQVYGRVDALRPVNIDYNATPSTTNNRDWVTTLHNGEANGNVTITMDHLAANTTTETFFTSTPPFNVYDTVQLNHSTVKYVLVQSVDRALKKITHAPITRTVLSGETATRYGVGNVNVLDRDGNFYQLLGGRDYTVQTFAADTFGFTINDNIEGTFSFAHTPFDPSLDTIMCRVYGTASLLSYSDATPVLSVAENSGVASRSGNLVFRMIRDAGIPVSLIDKDSWEFAAADSHTMGITIPETHDSLVFKTYKEIISAILASSLMRLTMLNNDNAGSGIYIGLSATAPLPTSGDFEISDSDYSSFSWEQIYSDVYSDLVFEFKPTDITSFSPVTPSQEATGRIEKQNLTVKHVDFISKLYETKLLQMDSSEAATQANRISFLLSRRRGIYRLNLPQSFISKAAVGVSFLTNRNHLPGFIYDLNTQNQRTLAVVEVQKGLDSVSLVLEDQLGVQENSGSW